MIRARGLVGLAVLPVLALTGCGTTAEYHPGVALRVGDQTVSTQRVAELADDYCTAVVDQLQGQALPRTYLNGRVASSLALRSAAQQFLDEHGATADSSYDEAVTQAEAQLATMKPAARDAIIEVQGAELFVGAAETAVGRDLPGGGASADAAKAAGQKAFASWLDRHQVELSPRYGVDLDHGTVVPGDTGVSFAASDVARSAAAGQPDPAYAASLPARQRCG